MVSTERGTLRVIHQSEFMASCSCEDFWRHKDYQQTEAEFNSRKEKSRDLQVVGISVKHGAVVIQTKTPDKRGARNHEVMVSRGDGYTWPCKHIIRALQTRALMPEHRNKEVLFSEEEANALAQFKNRESHEAGSVMDAVVATVNNVLVVGWNMVKDGDDLPGSET